MNRTELQYRLTSYLRIREALGMNVGSDSRVLENFIDFAGEECRNGLTSKVVFNWLDITTKQHLGNAAGRITPVRQFLLHLSASFPDTQIPEPYLLSSLKRPTPFVFSRDEIDRLVEGATDLAPGTLFSLVVRTVIGLLSAAGLRASEALNLDRADIALQDEQGVLLIRESKFHKSRIVPLHPSTVRHLAAYVTVRDGLQNRVQTNALFLSRQGKRLSYESLRQSFHAIVDRAGIRPRNGSRKPTLHSLRHSFVVGRLRSWHEQGVDVEGRLVHLATYLGHVGISESYWYMTATPELLSAAAAEFRPPALTGGEQ